MKKILIVCAITIGGIGLSGLAISLRNQSSTPPHTSSPYSGSAAATGDTAHPTGNTTSPKDSQSSGSSRPTTPSQPHHHPASQHAQKSNLTSRAIEAIKKLLPGGKKNASPADPASEPEPLQPAGRFRYVVFDEALPHKDLIFKSTYETQIVTNEANNKVLQFNEHAPKDLRLNIYEPQGDSMSKRPLLIFVYGGGWVLGDRYQQEAAAKYYAKLGYVTATIDYTMMPPDNQENPVMNPNGQPAMDVYTTIYYESSRDIYAAYQYLEAHQSHYKIDPTRVGLVGWSAGGQISGLLAHVSPLPSIPGLKAVVGASSILLDDLTAMPPFSGYKAFSSSYRPVSMFASYDEDTGFAGQPNDHASDCARLDQMGHPCITVTFPGSGHDLFFDQAPLKNPVVDFLATHAAGH